MLRGGGLCVEGPGGSSIPRISPRIRALQDRLLDSLPPDATWETLTPSQRDALILHGLHPPNLTFGPGGSTDDSSDVGEFAVHGGRLKVLRHQAGNIGRYGRSRSYDDRLESETDDSGVRALGGASSSSSGGARSNSQEDDSSDPGVKRAGRFAKASSGDRTTRRDNNGCPKSLDAAKNPRSAMKKVEVSNGRGNVNKIISKQYNKSAAVTSTGVSNITLDCRNVQGEKRRRSRVDIDGPFARERSIEKSLEVIQEREGGPRRTVAQVSSSEQISVVRRSAAYEGYDDESQLHSLGNFDGENKLISLKGMKESGSSEEYDSGVNFKYDKLDESMNMEEYIRERQEKGCEFYNDFDSDLSPRMEHMSSLEMHQDHQLQQQQQQLFQQQQHLMQQQQVLQKQQKMHQQNRRERSSDRLLSMEDVRVPRKALEHVSLDRSERSHNSRDRTKQRDTPGNPHEGREGGSRSHDGRHSSSTFVDSDFMERLSKMPGEPLKSNLKVGYGARMNTNFDYRTNLNQDQSNKYSSNWNSIILNNDVPIRCSSNLSSQGGAARESRYTKNANARSAGNLSSKTAAAMANQRRGEGSSWAGESRRTSNSSDQRRTPNPMPHEGLDPRRVPSNDRTMAKKYGRSKSLDRKYMEESTDEESDFEMRRRTDRERRYQKGNLEWEGGGRGRGPEDQERQRRSGIMIIKNDISDSRGLKPKAKSAWDLSTAGPYTKNPGDEFDEFNVDTGFRTRSDIRDRWRSEDSEMVSIRKKSSDSSSDLARVQWQRRSCDFYLEGDPEEDPEGDLEFDRNRWYRRSCDIDLDYDRHNGRKQELDLEGDWGRQALEEHDDFDSPEVAPGKKGRNAENGKPQTRNKVRYDIPVNSAGRNGKTKGRGGGEDDGGRKTRSDDHPRSRTSLGHYGKNEKRERSRTPHVLRGKLRLLKSILSF